MSKEQFLQIHPKFAEKCKEKFELQKAETRYFVTAFDNYSLKKGIEVLSGLKEVTELKSTLELNSTLSEYSYVNATVVNRNIGYC